MIKLIIKVISKLWHSYPVSYSSNPTNSSNFNTLELKEKITIFEAKLIKLDTFIKECKDTVLEKKDAINDIYKIFSNNTKYKDNEKIEKHILDILHLWAGGKRTQSVIDFASNITNEKENAVQKQILEKCGKAFFNSLHTYCSLISAQVTISHTINIIEEWMINSKEPNEDIDRHIHVIEQLFKTIEENKEVISDDFALVPPQGL